MVMTELITTTTRRLAVFLSIAGSLSAQVTFDRLVNAPKEPQNWLTYSGNLMSQRYTPLDQVTPQNVKNLELKWLFQARSLEKFEATPLVVDGVMYTVQAPNDVVALDPVTGRVFWIYSYAPSPLSRPCCGRINRGVAIAGDTLFMGTIDAHLVAIDAKNGKPLWNTTVAKAESGYALTHAPLVVKDKVIVGVAGGEFGIRGFIAAYDAQTGKECWKIYTIPGPGEPGHETWQGDDWQHGGSSIWVTGSYDPDLNLTYWGTGNPGPDWNPDQRPGDNLYSDCVLAIDPDTGKLKWYFQFTPHDPYDYDANETPVLVDLPENSVATGETHNLLVQANRNGFLYTLDRTNGKFLNAVQFLEKMNWAKTVDASGRPVLSGRIPTTQGTYICPGINGATNWFSPSYNPDTGLFY